MGFDWSAFTVLELANVLAGPSVGYFFAQLGARVIKVESPLGDVTRSWKLPTEDPNNDRPSYFSWINAGKESVILDYSSEADQTILQNIIAQSDLIITSFKPGDEEKFKLTPQHLHALQPKAIVASISAYGKNDPRVGYDALLQAESGFMFINGNSTDDFHKMPVALIDVLAAHHLIQKTLLALIDRNIHQKGAAIDVSLWEVALQSLTNQASAWLNAGFDPQPMGSEHPNIVPYGSIFRDANNAPFVLAIGSDHHFQLLAELLGIEIPNHWTHNADRVKNRKEINQQLQQVFSAKLREEWILLLQTKKLPIAPVLTVSEALSDTKVSDFIQKSGDFSHWRGPAKSDFNLSPPPKLGEHSDLIRQEFSS